MAFCRFCGKELQEGEVCSCQAGNVQPQDTAAQSADTAPAAGTASQETPVTPVQPAPAPADNGSPAQPSVTITLPNKDEFTDGLKKILSTMLNVLKHPATEGRAFVANGNKITAGGIIVVQALFSCLFSIIMMSRINLALDLEGQYKFSGIKAFFLTLLFSLIFSAFMMLLLWCASILMKTAANLEQMLSLTAVRSIGLLPMIILGTVFMIINTPTTISLGLVLYYGSILLGTIFLLEAVKGVSGVQDDKAAYMVFAVIVVFIFLFWLIGTKIAFSMYLPGALRDRIDNISSLYRMF